MYRILLAPALAFSTLPDIGTAQQPAVPVTRQEAPSITTEAGWTSAAMDRLQRMRRMSNEIRDTAPAGRHEVRLSFSVSRSGEISDAKVINSSGSNLIDESAVASLNRASPLPEFPEVMSGDSRKFELPYVYEIPERAEAVSEE